MISCFSGILVPSTGTATVILGAGLDRVGHSWRIPNVAGKRAIRHVAYDTNYWKSFIHTRLVVPMEDNGCLSLFGEHLTVEERVRTEGCGRTVDEWKMRPAQFDNH